MITRALRWRAVAKNSFGLTARQRRFSRLQRCIVEIGTFNAYDPYIGRGGYVSPHPIRARIADYRFSLKCADFLAHNRTYGMNVLRI